MKRRPSLSFVLFFLFVIFSPSESSAEHKTSPGGGDGILPKDPSISLPGLNGSGRVDYVDGDVIVKFRKRMWQEDIVHAKDIFPDLGTSAIHLLSKQCGQRHALIRSNALSTEEILVALEDHPLVESVSPNFRRRIAGRDIKRTTLGIADGGSLDADDTTGAKMIASIPHLPWTQFRPVIIAVVDTGIDYRHGDLAGSMWKNAFEVPGDGLDNDGNGYIDDVYGIDAKNNDSDPMDDQGHGTHVAGIVASEASDGGRIPDSAGLVKIMALKFLDIRGVGTDADAIKCIEYLLEMKRNRGINLVAINASWGGGENNPILEAAIEEAGDLGIMFCAAAGNNATSNDIIPFYPASHRLPNIISIGAIDLDNLCAYYSNYGLHSVDIMAPGSSIVSAVPRTCVSTDQRCFFDDMEYENGKWIADPPWIITEEEANSGSYAWSDSPAGPYVRGTDASFGLADPLDLSPYSDLDVFVDFWAFEDLDGSNAFVDIEVSGNNGQTWHAIGCVRDWDNKWKHYSFLISESYKTDQFKIRFHLIVSDNALYVWDGVYIDDIGIGTCNASDRHDEKSGTSMAAAHVSGACAMLALRHPYEDILRWKARIMTSSKFLPALEAMTITQGRLDVRRALSAGDRPAIFDIHPYSALPGEEMAIEGYGFGELKDQAYVTFPEDLVLKDEEITHWSNARIKCVVPQGAHAGRVKVADAIGNTTNGFSYLPPWIPGATMPFERNSLDRWSYQGSCTGGGLIWLVAGRRDADWKVLDNTGTYSPITDAWDTGYPVLNQPRVYPAAAANEEYVFALGGRSSSAVVVFDVVERLDLPDVKSWVNKALSRRLGPMVRRS